MLNIAFINPPHADWCLGNFAAYYMFQSHYTRFGKNVDKVNWLPAPYKYNRYENVEQIYEEIKSADIFLFSSYIWNYDICDLLAAHIKKLRPDAVCVLGGPQIGTNDPEFLATRHYYDFILQSTKPGEIFVTELIDSYYGNSGNPDYNELSWELRSDKTCEQFIPDYSVYEEHLDFLMEIRDYARDNYLEPFMVIETTRGCPYSCTFCEWGGGIGSKIYKKPIEIVQKDILALKTAGFRDVYLTDANFGAFFERDLEIFRFGWENGVNLTDISTMKSKDVNRRIKLVDAWFSVVGSGPETHSPVNTKKEAGHPLQIGSEQVAGLSALPQYISIVPTVSFQSVSDEAMRVAERVDLNIRDKIILSEHIHKRCHEEGFPVPAIELIMAMPGSTLADFYDEFNIQWNFKSWSSVRHDYMFLPDANLSKPSYLEKYKIKLVEVYADLIDEEGVDNQHSFYKTKRHYFKTIASCYSFDNRECCEMWFMNLAGNYLLKHLYKIVEPYCTPAEFGKKCFNIIKEIPEFDELWVEICDILNPDTPARNNKRLKGQIRNLVIDSFLEKYSSIIFSEVFSELHDEGRLDNPPVKLDIVKTKPKTISLTLQES
jgi:hypothetical protein